MNWKVLILAIALVSSGHRVAASEANGLLAAEIDGQVINLAVKCEESPAMLNSFSDFDVNGKSDVDGDGIFFTLGGIPSMGNILGVFNIRGKEYKFVHKGEFSLEKLVIPEMDVNRRDGTTYKIKIDLTCE